MIYLILGWLACAAGACWIDAVARGELTAFSLFLSVAMGPVAFLATVMAEGESVTLWRRK
jgi:hypothetical protein